MNAFLPESSSFKDLRKGMISTLLVVLLGFMISSSIAQVTSDDKYIYISGQITEAVSGAPIPDYELYILSDSLSNSGFSYYAVTKTDANGFYWDTVVTNLSDGILNLSLYDFENHLISIDRYYRFVWENEFQMFVDFAIYDPNSTIDFQASFGTAPDTSETDPLKVVFKDKSIGASIKSWDWDFGDGATSDIQDPEHVYAQPGNYMVTLTIGSHPPEFETFHTSTITKQVQVGLREFYVLGGHVFANYFPIDYGLTYLYAFDAEDNLVPIDTAVIDTLGYYYFYALPAGKYITKSRLQGISNLYGQFMPTYFGNVYIWDKAEVIDLNQNNFECDTWLLPSIGITSGNGQIIGQINYDTLRSYEPPIPAGNIEILLLDEHGQNLTCGLSDMEGYFRFANLAFGTYQLYPDVTGIRTSPMFVTISEEKPTASDFLVVIYPEEVTFSIRENTSDYIENAMLIYPNPVSEQARVSIDMKKTSTVDILILDPMGRTIYDESRQLQKGTNQVILGTGNFSAGYYQVVILPEDRVPVTGKLLKFN